MCFRLQIHRRWMMKTRAQSQRSHSGDPTPRIKQEDWGQESLRTNIGPTDYRSIAFVLSPANAAQHSTGQSPCSYYSVIQCMYTYTEATILSKRLTSCKPHVLRKRTWPKLTGDENHGIRSIRLSCTIRQLLKDFQDYSTSRGILCHFCSSQLIGWLTLLYSLMFDVWMNTEYNGTDILWNGNNAL